MALGFPFGFRVAASVPLDNKYGPYNSVATALAQVVAGERYIGLTVNVNGLEYWWKDATDDAGLVLKTTQGNILQLPFDPTSANIVLDFKGGGEVIFTASAPIDGNRTWTLAGNTNASRMEIIFTIGGTGDYPQTFPANFKMNDARWDAVNKIWKPYQPGGYIATAIFDGADWWMQVDGVYN
jgi:hypothetical protein